MGPAQLPDGRDRKRLDDPHRPRQGEAGTYGTLRPLSTSLVESFRRHYPDELRYEGKRAILFDEDDEVPEAALRHCIALALTYHLRKRSSKKA